MVTLKQQRLQKLQKKQQWLHKQQKKLIQELVVRQQQRPK